MQEELEAEHPELDIRFLAVNETGLESGMDDIAKYGDLPVLQDTAKDAVWDSWGVEWRDVYVLDEDNKLVTVMNLTTESLSDKKNYEALKAIVIATAAD